MPAIFVGSKVWCPGLARAHPCRVRFFSSHIHPLVPPVPSLFSLLFHPHLKHLGRRVFPFGVRQFTLFPPQQTESSCSITFIIAARITTYLVTYETHLHLRLPTSLQLQITRFNHNTIFKMQYRSVTSLAIMALASTAVAQQARVFTRASQSVKEFGIFGRQTDGYQPEDEICGGEGSTCAEACGTGYEQCSSSDEAVHCFNPADGESCCASGDGSESPSSFF